MAGKVRQNQVKKETKLAATSSAPKARSAYALFLSSRYESLRQNHHPRMIISKVAQEWRDMSDEAKAEWFAKSKAELKERQRQIGEMTQHQVDSEPSDNAASPNMIGKFKVVEIQRQDVHASLGQGSFAKTFLVKHCLYGYMAVGKVWSENLVERSHSIKAFKKELAVYRTLAARGCNKSSHPFCEVLEYSEPDAPTRFMVLQLAGISMSHWILKKGPMFEKVADVAFQVAKALVYLNVVAEFVHGDLKPSNLMFEEEAFRVKLVNFHLTQPHDGSGSVWDDSVYTLPYRPPELWNHLHSKMKIQGDFGQISPASDVWALGCICFELCTGDILFPAFPDIMTYCTSWDHKATSKQLKYFPAALARQNRSVPLVQFILETLDPDWTQRMSAIDLENSKTLAILRNEKRENFVVMC